MSIPNVLPPLAFCALAYLLQWLRHEQALHEAFSNKPSTETFRHALVYFRISRNFRGIAAKNRLQRALSLFCAEASRQGGTPSERVVSLASAFKKEFGAYNVSAASKLLWLTHRDPFIVLDARAVRALKQITGERFAPSDYAAYSRIWRSYYNSRHSEICLATSKIAKASEFLPANRPSDSALLKICSSEWFRERVLDIFLWESGNDG